MKFKVYNNEIIPAFYYFNTRGEFSLRYGIDKYTIYVAEYVLHTDPSVYNLNLFFEYNLLTQSWENLKIKI
jgi:hypothetical protein